MGLNIRLCKGETFVIDGLRFACADRTTLVFEEPIDAEVYHPDGTLKKAYRREFKKRTEGESDA